MFSLNFWEQFYIPLYNYVEGEGRKRLDKLEQSIITRSVI